MLPELVRYAHPTKEHTLKYGIGKRTRRIAHPTKRDWEIEVVPGAMTGIVTVKAYREDTRAALPLVTASGRDMVPTMTELDRKIDEWDAQR